LPTLIENLFVFPRLSTLTENQFAVASLPTLIK
jgi:hypothetical protein